MAILHGLKKKTKHVSWQIYLGTPATRGNASKTVKPSSAAVPLHLYQVP